MILIGYYSPTMGGSQHNVTWYFQVTFMRKAGSEYSYGIATLK